MIHHWKTFEMDILDFEYHHDSSSSDEVIFRFYCIKRVKKVEQ